MYHHQSIVVNMKRVMKGCPNSADLITCRIESLNKELSEAKRVQVRSIMEK